MIGMRTQIFYTTATRLLNVGLTPILLDGKAPVFKNFQTHNVVSDGTDALTITPNLINIWSEQFPNANVGVLLGGRVVALDIDDETIWSTIAPVLPATSCVKRGHKGWTFFYWSDARNPVERTRIFKSRIDGHTLLEVLSTGRYTALPPSIHPKTGLPYEWLCTHGEGSPRPLWEAMSDGTLGQLAQRDVEALENALIGSGHETPRRSTGSSAAAPELTPALLARLAHWVKPKREDWLAKVRAAGEGDRQSLLNNAVFDLARFVHAGVLDRDQLEADMREACAISGFLAERGEKLWSRDFKKALADGAAVALPDLAEGDAAEAARRLGAAPELSDGTARQAGPAAGGQARGGDGFRGTIVCNKHGNPIPSIENLENIWAHLGVNGSYDVFSDTYYVNGSVFDDKICGDMICDFERSFQIVYKPEYISRAFTHNARKNSFHPLQDYLRSLVWDRQTRIDTWMIDYCGAENTEWVRLCSALWLQTAVHRAMNPGCIMRVMPVFDGEQAIGKSTLLRILSINSAWFTDDIDIRAEKKDIVVLLKGKWIVEFGEMKYMRNTDRDAQKHFISAREDTAVCKYDRFQTRNPRSCVFAGTTNDKLYLSDETGNSRYWPISVARCDLEGLTNVAPQLWAEAMARDMAGVPYEMNPEHYFLAAAQQNARMTIDVWEDALRTKFDHIEDVSVTSDYIFRELGIAFDKQAQHSRKLGETMARLGFVKSRETVGGKRFSFFRKGWGRRKLI